MSLSIWEWPMDEFIQALYDRNLIDRSNPRPCSRCSERMVYGVSYRKHCPYCQEIMHRSRIESARKTHPCADCGAPIKAKAYRCLGCHNERQKANAA